MFLQNSAKFLQNRFAEVFYLLGRCLLAGVFLWSGLSKAYRPTAFAETVGAYGLLPDPLVFPAAILLIVAEVIVGIGLLIDQKGALSATTLLMLLFMAVLGYGIYLGLDIDCGCFGPDDPEATAFHDLRGAFFRDLLLLLLIAYLYLWRFANHSNRFCSVLKEV
ncbi:Methylamine utilisation protein MauE [Malonomonas rubra DSM 5091]|uniref:Methylamine utilisation protein MauE n=1 Tax=Malonomonas rubra DSM 5091 TaxID=1122189 RepID=A0A1M6K101_MALRU|nr:MauE/DoxX family redox-associated membrane protein [Malonomonas rubra]SHJ52597.1 Methylamine utilisation protein MauE [Malonomonas rubra DSM 5091]